MAIFPLKIKTDSLAFKGICISFTGHHSIKKHNLSIVIWLHLTNSKYSGGSFCVQFINKDHGSGSEITRS